jgi:tetratricopeptide (TPR) repeat protein
MATENEPSDTPRDHPPAIDQGGAAKPSAGQAAETPKETERISSGIDSSEVSPRRSPVAEQGDPVDHIARQAAAIERVAQHLAPEEVRSRLNRIFGRSLAIGILSLSSVAAGYELAMWIMSSWESRRTLHTWLDVAREVYEVEGNTGVAQAFLDRASEVDPHNTGVVRLQAYIGGMQAMETLLNLDRPWNQSELDQADMAKAYAILLQTLNRSSPDGLILRGQVTAALGEHGRAVGFLEEALRIDPQNAFVRVRLAMVHMTLAHEADNQDITDHEIKQAQDRLDQAVAIEPTSKLAALWQGNLAWLRANTTGNADQDGEGWTAAKGWFDRCIELDPRYHLPHITIGHMYMDAGAYELAAESYDRAIKLRPSNADALTGLGWSHGYRNEYEAGLLYARRANDESAGLLEAWRLRGLLSYELFLQTGNPEAANEAMDSYNQVLKLDPANGEAFTNRSALHHQLGNARLAGQDARMATRLAPYDAFAWWRLGEFQASLSPAMHEEAERSFRRSLELDETLDSARAGLARSLVGQMKFDAASDMFDRLVANPASEDMAARNLHARGAFHEQCGRLPEAINDYRAARTVFSEYFAAWLGEARTCVALQRFNEADTALAMCRQLEPDDPDVSVLVAAVNSAKAQVGAGDE